MQAGAWQRRWRRVASGPLPGTQEAIMDFSFKLFCCSEGRALLSGTIDVLLPVMLALAPHLPILLLLWPWYKSVWQWEQLSMLRGSAISGALHGCSVIAFLTGNSKLSTSCPELLLRFSERTTSCPQAFFWLPACPNSSQRFAGSCAGCTVPARTVRSCSH